jgi:hypothetical protein
MESKPQRSYLSIPYSDASSTPNSGGEEQLLEKAKNT